MNYLRVAILFAVLPIAALGAEYEIVRSSDGPFAFKISGIGFNEGSTLQRESILFNEPSCPVTLTSHTTSFAYEDRNFHVKATTGMNLSGEIRAIRIVTAQYDVFGQHIRNLGNVEIRDFSGGSENISGEWRARDESLQLLTSITYVARVRMADGSQWVFNEGNLRLALSSLNLEQKIEDEKN